MGYAMARARPAGGTSLRSEPEVTSHESEFGPVTSQSHGHSAAVTEPVSQQQRGSSESSDAKFKSYDRLRACATSSH